MAMLVTAECKILPKHAATNVSASDPAPASTNFQAAYTASFPVSGTSDNSVDIAWPHINLSLTTNETFDLTSLAGAFGATLTLVKVRMFYFENTSPTVSMTLGAAGTNPWIGAFSGSLVVPPLGCICLCAPVGTSYPVVAAASNNLKITSGGAGGAYKMVIDGTTA